MGWALIGVVQRECCVIRTKFRKVEENLALPYLLEYMSQ